MVRRYYSLVSSPEQAGEVVAILGALLLGEVSNNVAAAKGAQPEVIRAI